MLLWSAPEDVRQMFRVFVRVGEKWSRVGAYASIGQACTQAAKWEFILGRYKPILICILFPGDPEPTPQEPESQEDRQPIRYFARQLSCTDYPYKGELVWGVLTSRGLFSPCRDQQSAEAEAMLKNALAEGLPK